MEIGRDENGTFKIIHHAWSPNSEFDTQNLNELKNVELAKKLNDFYFEYASEKNKQLPNALDKKLNSSSNKPLTAKKVKILRVKNVQDIEQLMEHFLKLECKQPSGYTDVLEKELIPKDSQNSDGLSSLDEAFLSILETTYPQELGPNDSNDSNSTKPTITLTAYKFFTDSQRLKKTGIVIKYWVNVPVSEGNIVKGADLASCRSATKAALEAIQLEDAISSFKE
jgi:hypothetical protein